jgi:hypothetical protein
MRHYQSLPGPVDVRPPQKKQARRSGTFVLLAGIALTALTALPAGKSRPVSHDFPTANIQTTPRLVATAEHRLTPAAAKLTLSDIIFGDPVYAAGTTSPMMAQAPVAPDAPVVSNEQPPAPAPAEVASIEPVAAPAPEAAKTEIIPLPPVNPFRTAQRTTVARSAVSPRNAPAVTDATIEEPGFFQRLFGSASEEPSNKPSSLLAYAPATDDRANPLREMSPFRRTVPPEKTAIYVINQSTVYMPDGSKLEAHSGIGAMRDNPRYAHLRMKGPTPPNVYTLRMREKRFHGVEAIRMLPEQPGRMHGRDGILAHSYLLGPNGDSHGCVAFKDYNRFLNAFKRGEVTRIVVVADGSSMLAMR